MEIKFVTAHVTMWSVIFLYEPLFSNFFFEEAQSKQRFQNEMSYLCKNFADEAFNEISRG